MSRGITDCGYRPSATNTTGAGRYRAAESRRIIFAAQQPADIGFGLRLPLELEGVALPSLAVPLGEGSVVTRATTLLAVASGIIRRHNSRRTLVSGYEFSRSWEVSRYQAVCRPRP